jgi:polysaccharide pyruvyl transferase WcaK-like protein
MARTFQTIGLLEHLGYGNLGDDATLDAVMQNIRRRRPGARMIGLTFNPSDTSKRHGIPSYPIRRGLNRPPASSDFAKEKVKTILDNYRFFLALLRISNTILLKIPRAVFLELVFLIRSFRIAKSLDLLIICGGGQLLDSWGGPWRFPFTLFKWVLLAKLSNASCYVINVGAGPLSKPLSKWFIKWTLHLADYVSFRDDKSRRLIQEIGYKAEHHVYPDNVYGLTIPALIANRDGKRREPIVGISPMCYCDPRVYWDRNKSVYDCYIQKLAPFASWLIHNQHPLVLFSTDLSFDSHAMEDLKSALAKDMGPGNPLRIAHEPITAIEEMFSQMSSMEYIVTCRFHGVVFAHLLNIPVLAISHHPKVASLMSDLGLSEYCLDISTFDFDLLTSTFTRLVENRVDIKARMAKKATCYQMQLEAQFDQLFCDDPTADSTHRISRSLSLGKMGNAASVSHAGRARVFSTVSDPGKQVSDQRISEDI